MAQVKRYASQRIYYKLYSDKDSTYYLDVGGLVYDFSAALPFLTKSEVGQIVNLLEEMRDVSSAWWELYVFEP